MNLNVNAIVPDKNVVFLEVENTQVYEGQSTTMATGAGKPPYKKQAIKKDDKEEFIKTHFPPKVIGSEIGMVKKIKGTYYVCINKTNAEMVFENSWIADFIDYEIFDAAIKLHELAHVRYSDFGDEDPDGLLNTNSISAVDSNNEVLQMVMNILEDARVEYAFCLDFPECSIFFNILLAAIKREYKSSNNAFFSELMKSETDEVEELMTTLFDFARYNIIAKGANLVFTGKIMPLTLLARRGTSNDCELAAKIICKMLQDEVDNSDMAAGNEIPNGTMIETIDGMSKEDKEAKMQKLDKNMQGIADKVFDEATVKDKIEEASKVESGQEAGNAVVQNKVRSTFFIDTVKKRRNEIEQLRRIFQKAFTEYKNVRVKEGDMNFKKQQDAYLNSITGEEGLDYLYRKKEQVLVDIVIARDISGSTSSFQNIYAESLVVFLAALENIDGIRTAQIDFNGTDFENKNFDSDLDSATINPVASGGTSIRGTYKRVLNYHFKGKRNLVIVLTDGEFYENKEEVNRLEKEIQSKAKLSKFLIGTSGRKEGYGSIKDVNDIPTEMMKVVIKEGLQ